MTLDSMTRTVDASALWPMGDEWDWHTGNPLVRERGKELMRG